MQNTFSLTNYIFRWKQNVWPRFNWRQGTSFVLAPRHWIVSECGGVGKSVSTLKMDPIQSSHFLNVKTLDFFDLSPWRLIADSLFQPINLKFCLEGMEESGSLGLDELLRSRQNTDFLIDVDYICISDNYWLSKDKPCITYGLRGNCYFFVEVECSNQDLHSGKKLSILMQKHKNRKWNLRIQFKFFIKTFRCFWRHSLWSHVGPHLHVEHPHWQEWKVSLSKYHYTFKEKVILRNQIIMASIKTNQTFIESERK